MPENKIFLPEGLRPQAVLSLPALKTAMENETILEGTVLRCDVDHALHVSLGGLEGLIPREEALAPWISGAGREIALLSRVGKSVCFIVTSVEADGRGAPLVVLSRRAVQEKALSWFLEILHPGMVLTTKVTHLEPFGAFLDIGCGIIAMLPIENISVSRISHPSERFQTGQKLLAAVASVDREKLRFTMTHKELLGTWLENASYFHAGETVKGTIRSVKDYGCFVELTPNLSGLADGREDISEGDSVSVYLKSIRPERMKIKLQIIEKLPREAAPQPLKYQITDGQLTHWVYSPPNYEKDPVVTDFTLTP